jgi:hypothetical protein
VINTIKEYKVDYQKKQNMIRTEPNKDPKWIKRKKVRQVLYILCIVVPAAFILYGWLNPEIFTPDTPPALRVLMLFLIGMLFSWMPTTIYCKQTYEYTVIGIKKKDKENLVLLEDRLLNGYQLSKEFATPRYDVDEIKYTDIKRIVINEDNDFLKVYGRYKTTKYNNYEENDIWYIWEVTEDMKSKLTDYREGRAEDPTYGKDVSEGDCYIWFNLYYYNSDDFVKTLSERSGVAVEIDGNP